MKGIGVAEVVIIIGLLLIFISGFLPETQTKEEDLYIAVKEIGALSPSSGDVVHIKLASNVLLGKGVEGNPLLIENDKKTIAKGFITAKEHSIEFDIPQDYYNKLEAVTLKLVVDDSNYYGDLIIYLNGNKIWQGKPKLNSALLIDLPKDLLKQGENIILLKATSSGWRIWAPTFYEISYLEIGEKLNLKEEASFNFTVTNSLLSKYSYGRVYIGNVKVGLAGELGIILNDENVIYTGMPTSGPFIVSFYYPLKEENTLTFKLLENGYYEMKNLEVILFTSKNASDASSMEFTIPKDKLKEIKSGKYNLVIEVNIKENDDKNLKINFIGTEDILLYDSKASGKLVLTVPSYKVAQRNIIRFETNGKYVIGNVVVKLVKNK